MSGLSFTPHAGPYGPEDPVPGSRTARGFAARAAFSPGHPGALDEP